MKVEAEKEVFAFQAWLHESLRRTWVLAIAVAIPGAFLVTLWFPTSGLALVVVALIGVGIGVVADSIEETRKRKRREFCELLAAIDQGFRHTVARFESEKAEHGSQSELSLAAELEIMKEELTRSHLSNLKVAEDITALRNLFVPIAAKLRSSPYLFYQSLPYMKYMTLGSEALMTENPVPFKYGSEILAAEVGTARYQELFGSVAQVARETGVSVEHVLNYLAVASVSADIRSEFGQRSEKAHEKQT